MAYRVAHMERERVVAKLDHREKGGYERHRVEVHVEGDRIDALVYVATSDNPNYLGPASISEIAAQVRGSSGPSGPNLEYVLRLADALRHIGAEDAHVFELAAEVGGAQAG